MNLTIMCYNIERGFHSSDHHMELHRIQAAQRAVKIIKPDILALTEACYGGPNMQGISMDYRQIFGLPYGQFGGYPVFGPKKGDEGGNCILSRLPMYARPIILEKKGAIRAQIALEKRVLMLDVVHPSYSTTDEEKITVLQPLLASRKEPYIITGDFNTVHPDDTYDWDALLREITESMPKRAEQLLHTWRHPKLVQWLLEQNLIDSFAGKRKEATVPTPHGNPKSTVGVRMDFLLCSPDIRVKDAYVLKNADTAVASDHYPIVAKVVI